MEREPESERHKVVLEQHRSGFRHRLLLVVVRTSYIIVAIGQVQRGLVLHVAQHGVGAGLAEEIGDGRVLPPHGEMERRAAVEHGGVHVGAAVEQQLHRRGVVNLHGEMERRFAAGSLLYRRGGQKE